jgi:hypothetical protein
MTIFTQEDYKRIQAWLKANAVKDSDFEITEFSPNTDTIVITRVENGVSINYKASISNVITEINNNIEDIHITLNSINEELDTIINGNDEKFNQVFEEIGKTNNSVFPLVNQLNSNNITGENAFATGTGNIASGSNSHAEGVYTIASGTESHA